MEDKKRVIEHQIGADCSTIGIDTELPLDKQIDQLKIKQTELFNIKKYKMKSKVQTYDIRDSEDYNGFLELEVVLRENRQSTVDKLNNSIRRSANKLLQMKTIREKANLMKLTTNQFKKDCESNWDLEPIQERDQADSIVSEMSDS